MIRLRGVAVFLICLPAFVGCHAQAGLTQGLGAKIWVGRYQEIEEHLRTGECVRMEALAFNYTTRCTLRPGGPFTRMAWRARCRRESTAGSLKATGPKSPRTSSTSF